MRCAQPPGERGSLKWIQRAIEANSPEFNGPIIANLKKASTVEWLSPLRADDYAEYRDGSFLSRLGLDGLEPKLKAFWPARGPQWDALGRTDAGQILIIEAKAHVGEFCSPPSSASSGSLDRIKAAFRETARGLGVSSAAANRWHLQFYQYCNRLAHLGFLRQNGVDAHLVFVSFCGDNDMPGDATPSAWKAAYQVADFALGLPRRHLLSPYIVHVHPDITAL